MVRDVGKFDVLVALCDFKIQHQQHIERFTAVTKRHTARRKCKQEVEDDDTTETETERGSGGVQEEDSNGAVRAQQQKIRKSQQYDHWHEGAMITLHG